jgi:uncharacterized Zn finger protein (UPF0148 family)
MKKKSVEPKKLLDMQCPKCGRVTHHYLNELTGEYKCVVCQSVNKTIKVKPKKEVVFEMDAELDAALNPDPVEEILQNAGTEMTSEGPVLDDQGNPVND